MTSNQRQPKIKGIVNKECSKEKAIFFTIEITEDLHKSLISFLREIGLKGDSLQDFDTTYENEELFIFGCNSDLRVYLVNGSLEKEIVLIISGLQLDEEHILKKAEQYFKIF